MFGGGDPLPIRSLEDVPYGARRVIGLAKQYLLFVWKPIRSNGTYAMAEAYSIENGRLNTNRPATDKISPVNPIPTEKHVRLTNSCRPLLRDQSRRCVYI